MKPTLIRLPTEYGSWSIKERSDYAKSMRSRAQTDDAFRERVRHERQDAAAEEEINHEGDGSQRTWDWPVGDEVSQMLLRWVRTFGHGGKLASQLVGSKAFEGMSSRSIGKWLLRHQGKVYGSYKIDRAGFTQGKSRWRVVNIAPRKDG